MLDCTIVAGRSSSRVGVFHRPERIEPLPPTRVPPTEADLVRGIGGGERWAADALYELLYPTVARSLQRVLCEAGPDYQDLVQATFERIIWGLLEPRAERVLSLSACASGVASHIALDSLRSKVRERRLFQRSEGDVDPSVDVAVTPQAERQVGTLGSRWRSSEVCLRT
jgi:DNA-directed RNA polymerase specialized sigma24 family protein